MSGEDRLPQERWRRVGMSDSLKGRRSEEMNQSNTSSCWGQKSLLSPRRVMTIKVFQNEKISAGVKNGERKEVGYAITWRRANRAEVLKLFCMFYPFNKDDYQIYP